MYKKILHNTDNLSSLERDLCRIRAKITAKKIHSMGINESDIYSSLDNISNIPKEARGRFT